MRQTENLEMASRFLVLEVKKTVAATSSKKWERKGTYFRKKLFSLAC